MTELDIRRIPVLGDNYVYLVHDAASGATAAVDPALAQPVLETLDGLGWKLSHVLITHHHGDHTGGNLEVKQATGCTIIGGRGDAARIPGIDVEVGEGDTVNLGGHQGRVIEVPGHTSGHVAYWFAESKALFCGDTLFSLGCGRIFEGTPEDMWSSLCKLRELPDEARVYCAHEYTVGNADFALSIDPDNLDLRRRSAEAREQRREGRSTVPSTMAGERAANPFLRADDGDLGKAVGVTGGDPVSAFAEIRRRKDRF